MPARPTIVSFHAHPDDETIVTGGVLARAAAEGHRVVLVVATRGEAGEVADGVLLPGESLAERRVAETHRAAEILGIARVEFLGYADSGMAGDAPPAPGTFAAADPRQAAPRLASILEEERAAVLTVYDERGGYGHPDHVQVHRVGHRAATMAGTPGVYEATINRDHVRRLASEVAAGPSDGSIDLPSGPDIDGLGVPEARITTTVDVSAFVDTKRAAMAAHASQIDHESFFLSLPPDAFRQAFGTEWFIRRDAPPGLRETDLWSAVR